MNDNLGFCMVTAVERDRRKLIYIPSHNAQDYLSYCEEVGCEWEGLLNSIPEKFEQAALIELPEAFVEKGFSKFAAGIEVPCFNFGADAKTGAKLAIPATHI